MEGIVTCSRGLAYKANATMTETNTRPKKKKPGVEKLYREGPHAGISGITQ